MASSTSVGTVLLIYEVLWFFLYWKHYQDHSYSWDHKFIHFFYIKYLLFFSDFNYFWIFWMDFWKFFQYKISWKSVRWEPSCSMLMDGQTDMTKLGVTFFAILQTCLKTKISSVPLQKLENSVRTCVRQFANSC
jgi:hypothetical protein